MYANEFLGIAMPAKVIFPHGYSRQVYICLPCLGLGRSQHQPPDFFDSPQGRKRKKIHDL